MGRASELDMLARRLDDARHGRAQVVFLRCLAGIGKSSLPHVFLTGHSLSGATVLRARCHENTSRSPFSAVRDLSGPLDINSESTVDADSGARWAWPGEQAGRVWPPRGQHRIRDIGLLQPAPAHCGAMALGTRNLLVAAADRMNGLTGSERRVAGLAVTGASNLEIAESLFVTLRTVEIHLTSAYRKLGITGSTELAAFADSAGSWVAVPSAGNRVRGGAALRS